MPLFEQPGGSIQIPTNPRLTAYGSQPATESNVVGQAFDDAQRRSNLTLDDIVARPARREAAKQEALDSADRAIANRAVRPITTKLDIAKAQDELELAPARKALLQKQIGQAGGELDIPAATLPGRTRNAVQQVGNEGADLDIAAATKPDELATKKAGAKVTRAAAEGTASKADTIASAAGAKVDIDKATLDRALADPEGNRAEIVKMAGSMGIEVDPKEPIATVAEKVRRQALAMFQMKAWGPGGVNTEQENALRKELEGSVEYKNFKEQGLQYNALKSALAPLAKGVTPTSLEQQTAAHAFLKLMDPQLSVRGTSYATLEHASGKPAQWAVELNNVLHPTKPILLPNARLADMRAAADKLFAENKRAFEVQANAKRGQASMYPGVRPDAIYKPDAENALPGGVPQPNIPGTPATPPVPGAVLHHAEVNGKDTKVWVAPDGKQYPAR